MSAPATNTKKRYTFEEYIMLEEQERIRYEYYEGEVFAMAGGTLNHSSISGNINNAFDTGFSEKGCRSFQADVKVQLRNGNSYVYPDVVLTCDAEDVNAEQFIKHPVLIVEVLSPATESHDRNIKWHQYRRIPSLRYFLFISQQLPFVELYSRTGPNALYQYQAFDQIEDVIELPELEFSLSLQQVYRNIRFPENNTSL
jgi:Uma2 family endonuclease